MKNFVLVTGACINTGVAIVEKFASEGENVVFTGRNACIVSAMEQEYRKKYPHVQILGMPIDSLDKDGNVDEENVETLFSSLDSRDINITTLVLNAADQGLGQEFYTSSISEFQRVLNTNVTWNYCLSKAAACRMKGNGGGCIIFINSNTAYRCIPNRVAYSTSKGAQLSMMRALALDLGKDGIRVNAVLPGMIKTDRWERNPEFYQNVPSRYTPLGDVAVGSDIADAVWYFAAHARNTTGAELVVDGGNTIQLYPLIHAE